VAKATLWTNTDAETRKRGKQAGHLRKLKASMPISLYLHLKGIVEVEGLNIRFGQMFFIVQTVARNCAFGMWL